jgi:putrescine aminotransferase
MRASATRVYRTRALPFGGAAREALGAGVAISARGATVWTDDGRELVDFASGGFGYGHPGVRAAVARQMRELPLSSRHLLSGPLAAFVERMASTAPGDLEVTYPCNSGSEAVEGALKLARGHDRRRTTVIAATGAHHGSTLGALALSEPARLGRELEDAPVDVVRVPYGDAEAVARVADARTAAVIVEPVSTAAAVITPPDGYLTSLRGICRSTGALLIADEVTTGLGRTGARFGVDRERVVPDVMVLAGALGGGVMPAAAYVTTRRVNDRVYRRQDPVLHASTTGGNPLACAAALAALEVFEAERLAERCAEGGAFLAAALDRIGLDHPDVVLGTSALGLLGSLRLPDERAGRDLQRRSLDAGLLLRVERQEADSWFATLTPPLTTSREELERGVEALATALAVPAAQVAAG